MDLSIEQCKCQEGYCYKGANPEDCVGRLPGGCVAQRCEACGGTTWHNQGVCVPCTRQLLREREDLRDSSTVEQEVVNLQVAGSNPAPAANAAELDDPYGLICTITPTKGQRFSVAITDEKLAIKILGDVYRWLTPRRKK